MLLAAIESSVTNPLVWGAFVVFVLLAIGVDLGLYRRSQGMSTRLALTWVGVWVCFALLFAAGVWHYLGKSKAEEFLAGYLLEESLSVDNLFVFVLVFSHFKTPRAEQHRVLVWGILGAMVLRAIMIAVGATLVATIEWILLVFAAILLVSGLKLLFKGDEDDSDPSDSWIVRTVRKVMPVTDGYRGHAFFVHEDGKRKATLLFMVLIVIEASDVIFAVDSIPAIFGVTKDPFIVFTSNIFAILGLRSLFFVIEAAIQRLRYLKIGLAFLLCFIAVKMSIPFIYEFAEKGGVHLPVPPFLDVETRETDVAGVVKQHVKLPISYSLGVIVATLGFTTLLSILIKPKHKGGDSLAEAGSGRLPAIPPGPPTSPEAPAAGAEEKAP
jgi:tellurite resistance protein TerC